MSITSPGVHYDNIWCLAVEEINLSTGVILPRMMSGGGGQLHPDLFFLIILYVYKVNFVTFFLNSGVYPFRMYHFVTFFLTRGVHHSVSGIAHNIVLFVVVHIQQFWYLSVPIYLGKCKRAFILPLVDCVFKLYGKCVTGSGVAYNVRAQLYNNTTV